MENKAEIRIAAREGPGSLSMSFYEVASLYPRKPAAALQKWMDTRRSEVEEEEEEEEREEWREKEKSSDEKKQCLGQGRTSV